MGTKVKGFFKGLKHISNMFDEKEEPAVIRIGMPTDVKHVAHIGADGPATESPSWMKGFNGERSQSGPMESSGGSKQGGIKNHRSTRSEDLTRGIPDEPKRSRHRRRRRSMDDSSDSDSNSRARRHRVRRSREKGDLPDIPKRSRRKKSKDDDGSTRSRDSESSSCYEPHLDL
ncbi:hypothetical protein SSX86_026781 [Deinandra increscens subsp. villosa]|uniref:CRIB domain-containing protein n=1 Tax=Deinandra increscens subsp. villosa TaxID=3103831 RepID=A0AAP0GND7_9ASTR